MVRYKSPGMPIWTRVLFFTGTLYQVLHHQGQQTFQFVTGDCPDECPAPGYKPGH